MHAFVYIDMCIIFQNKVHNRLHRQELMAHIHKSVLQQLGIQLYTMIIMFHYSTKQNSKPLWDIGDKTIIHPCHFYLRTHLLPAPIMAFELALWLNTIFVNLEFWHEDKLTKAFQVWFLIYGNLNLLQDGACQLPSKLPRFILVGFVLQAFTRMLTLKMNENGLCCFIFWPIRTICFHGHTFSIRQ